MIILHDFGINVKQYFQLGKKNKFPLVPCQRCKRFDHLKKNGFYYRYIVGIDTDGEYLLIPIRVLYCKRCQEVTSILPSFCVPYKIHTVLTFELFFGYLFFTRLSLAKVVERARRVKPSYQLAQAWIRSFKENLTNLTCELRSLCQEIWTESSSPSPQRFQDIFPAWWSLQSLALSLSPQGIPQDYPFLEKSCLYLFWKRRLGLFRYLG